MRNIVLTILFVSCCLFLSAVQDTIYVLHTTDVHGNLLSYNYFKDKSADKGLTKIATFIKDFRHKHQNVILLDGGDMIQGTPLTYLFNHVETEAPHPVIAAMNFMGYDAMSVGNHEIEQGLDVCTRLQEESNFSWLSANSILDKGRSYFDPYLILQVAGLKIGILGMTTPGIPKWLDSSIYEGISWKDIVETSRNHITDLREQSDIVIGLFHSGLKPDPPEPGLPQENASGQVADEVPGFDIILGGHSHNTFPVDTLTITNRNEPLQLISGYHGSKVGVIKVVLERNNGQVSIVEKSGWNESILDYISDLEMDTIFAPYHKKTLDFIRRRVAETQSLLTTADAQFQDNPLIDLINLVQLKVTGADVSFTSCFNTRVSIEAGPVRVKDIYSIYPYENFLYTFEMEGRQLKQYLEFAARYYQLEDEDIIFSTELSGYNYDIAEGISYKIDLTEPLGSRIKDIRLLASGKLLLEDEIYTVALNSFRGSGGGGYLKEIGLTEPEIIFKSSQEIRNLIIEYLSSNPGYIFETNNNWKTLMK
ncbi:bifunctional metallophosphatase/5'-nucleotidase [Candidatus Cloacimonadota bacterium]